MFSFYVASDCSEISGHLLLRCFLKSMLQRPEKFNRILCVLMIRNSLDFTENFATEDLKRLIWKVLLHVIKKFFTVRIEFCTEIPSTSSSSDAILFDSLSSACLIDGISPVLRNILLLNQSKNEENLILLMNLFLFFWIFFIFLASKIPIVALIHADLHSDEELASFRHISNVYLRLFLENSRPVCESTQKKLTKTFRKVFKIFFN